jgi:hypothetical protein
MTRIFGASALVAAAVWGVLLATPASAQPFSDLSNPQIEIAYVEPSNPVFRPIYEKLKKRRVLEELKAFLSPLRLPRTVWVKIEQCDRESRPYEPGGAVTICYEYVHQLEKLAEKIPINTRTARGVGRDDAVVGAFVQVVLHEMSHVVFDVLQVPVWGREEDAADKLAGFLMLQFGTDVARKLLNGAAYFFEASDQTWTGSDFSGVYGTEAQRFYNYLCIAYGGDEKAFKDFVVDTSPRSAGRPKPADRADLLPERRIPWCRGEYTNVQYAFEETIMPSVDRDLMRKVLATQWLRPDDGK